MPCGGTSGWRRPPGRGAGAPWWGSRSRPSTSSASCAVPGRGSRSSRAWSRWRPSPSGPRTASIARAGNGWCCSSRGKGTRPWRRPPERRSLCRAARAGLQDSAPRAALLSLHARVSTVATSAWEDEAFVQLWGPRRAVYVVAEQDRGVFSLGTLPRDPKARRAIEALAGRLRDGLAGRTMPAGEAARAAGELHPNQIKVAGATGTVLIRWDGAREPSLWSTEPPPVDPHTARLELARRYV